MDVIISPKLTVLLWSHQIFSGEKKKLKELKKKKKFIVIDDLIESTYLLIKQKYNILIPSYNLGRVD